MSIPPATILSPGVLPPHRGILRVAARTLVLAVVGLAVLTAVGLLGLKLAGWQALTVLTGSMRPTIVPGQVVIVSPQRASAIRRGEIITFRRPAGPGTLTHRVIAIRPAADGRLRITTRGDANPGGETWQIASSGTVGQHRATLPAVGGAIGLLVAGHGRPFFVGGVSLLGALLVLWWIWAPEHDRWGRSDEDEPRPEPESS